jgi:hypothetical protein
MEPAAARAKDLQKDLPKDLPKDLKSLHDGMIVELNRHLRSGLERGQAPRAAGPRGNMLDVSAYISRIERAAGFLEASAKRVRQLEDEIYDGKKHAAEAVRRLEDARIRAAELEQQLAAERERATRAEALAIAGENRAGELQQALASANELLENLTGVIERSFKGFDEPAPSAREVA